MRKLYEVTAYKINGKGKYHPIIIDQMKCIPFKKLSQVIDNFLENPEVTYVDVEKTYQRVTKHQNNYEGGAGSAPSD